MTHDYPAASAGDRPSHLNGADGTETTGAPDTAPGAPSALDLPALIGSRLCHDLISPLGAIGNGIELLNLSPEAAGSPEIALISDSVEHASGRLRFFRVAFGIASPDQRLGMPETRSILAGMTRTGRLAIDWTPKIDLPRNEVKLAFLAIMCVESALPLGGRIVVSQGKSGWSLAGEGRRLRIEPELWEPLAAGRAPAQLTPAQVQFALLPLALAALGRRATLETTETEITLRF